MKKTIILIGSFICLWLIPMACDQGKTMQEYIREEKKAIERYIQQKHIVVLEEYPHDRKFQENEYFKTKEGLYMHVVDSGNAHRIETYHEVLLRFEYMYYIKNYVAGNTDSITISYVYFPITFHYGISNSGDVSGLACRGFAIPLDYVGEGAVVDLIIPSELGNATDNSNFSPTFYRNLKYTKFN